jgi:GT2 family glycosyltransferase
MIDAKLFHELGGFSEDYIVGDFEDSDLCLRAREAGRRNYIASDVELFHLERQSQQLIGDASWRRNLTAYNCWLHNRRWANVIEQIGRGTGSPQPHIASAFDDPANQQRLAAKSQS